MSDIKELMVAAAAGKLTPEQWMELPPDLQKRLLPILIHHEHALNIDPKEARKLAHEIAKGASWGSTMAGLEQLGMGCFFILVIGLLFAVFALLFGTH